MKVSTERKIILELTEDEAITLRSILKYKINNTITDKEFAFIEVLIQEFSDNEVTI